MRRPIFKVITPSPKPQPATKTKAKPQPRVLEHVRYGQGKLVSVWKLDNGDYVASVKFGDGAERVIQLRQPYWVSDIVSVIPTPPKLVVPKKAQPMRSLVADDETEESEESSELDAA